MSSIMKRAKPWKLVPAVSMILGPSGEILGDTLCESEGLLYQDIDIAQCVEPKQFHDIVGYYNRFDVFDLKVDRTRRVPIRFDDDGSVSDLPQTADISTANERRAKAER